MEVGVGGRVVSSDTDAVIRKLKRNAADLPKSTATRFNAEAAATAPVLTGRMKDRHKVVKVGPNEYKQIVDVEYGVYVDRGTRNQAAQPWWSQALAVAKRRFTNDVKKMLK